MGKTMFYSDPLESVKLPDVSPLPTYMRRPNMDQKTLCRLVMCGRSDVILGMRMDLDTALSSRCVSIPNFYELLYPPINGQLRHASGFGPEIFNASYNKKILDKMFALGNTELGHLSAANDFPNQIVSNKAGWENVPYETIDKHLLITSKYMVSILDKFYTIWSKTGNPICNDDELYAHFNQRQYCHYDNIRNRILNGANPLFNIVPFYYNGR